MCEEKVTGIRSQTINEGSPPRVRGKDKPDEKKFTFGRITPAYAGKSAGRAATPTRCRDHPRVCGEKSQEVHVVTSFRGSPPRMQGKDIFPDGLPCAVRITPACAGKSRSQPRLPCTGRDHPRVCEEKNFLLLMTSRRSGSPPRVRGKVFEQVYTRIPFRITPAYAGKSVRRENSSS